VRGIIPPPHPQRGRGVIWFVRSPLLRSSPLPLPQRGRGVIWFVRSPLLCLSPPSSPTAWERSDLVREIAPAPLIPPFLSRSVGEEGGWGKVRGIIPPPHPQRGRGVIWFVRSPLLRSSPPSSPAAWERKGVGGKVRGIIPPPHPQGGRGVIWFVRSPLLRSSPLPLPQRGEEGVGGR
jgi:hypothetical protein